MNIKSIFDGGQRVKARRVLWRVMWLLLGVALLSYTGYRAHRNYFGYCFAQDKYLSDPDFVRAAVRYSAGEIANVEDSDSSARAFIDSHPACCKVDKTTQLTSGWFSRVLGSYWIGVEMTYEVRPDRATKTGNRNYWRYVQLNACAARGDMFGEFVDP